MMIRFLLLLLVPAMLVNGQDLRRRRPISSNRRAMVKGSSVVSVEDEMEETELNFYWKRKLEFSSSIPSVHTPLDVRGKGKGGHGKAGPSKAGSGKGGLGRAPLMLFDDGFYEGFGIGGKAGASKAKLGKAGKGGLDFV